MGETVVVARMEKGAAKEGVIAITTETVKGTWSVAATTALGTNTSVISGTSPAFCAMIAVKSPKIESNSLWPPLSHLLTTNEKQACKILRNSRPIGCQENLPKII